MRLHELMESIDIQYRYISDDDMYGDEDDDNPIDNGELDSQARDLVKRNNIGVLRGDELTIVALVDGSVIGAMFQAHHHEDMSWTVVVDSNYRGEGIAKQLYKMMDIPENVETITAELVSPYTLEPFVKKMGYQYVGINDGIKIYNQRVR